MNQDLVIQAINHPEVVETIMQRAPLTVLTDFAFMALLIFLGKVIRTKVKFLQDFFVPVSVIAGILGLVFGPQGLDAIPFSSFIGKYAWLLVVVLFASFPLGATEEKSKKGVMEKAGVTFLYSLWAEVSQFALASVIGLVLMNKLWPEIHQGFAWTMPAGFVGGHGYATAIGTTLMKFGFDDGVTIGMTMATIGIISAVCGGIIIIQLATKKGYTRNIQESKSLPQSVRTGLIPENQRQSIGTQTISSMSIDPLAWHVALILTAALGGIYLTKSIGEVNWLQIGGKSLYIPEVCTAMILGILLQKILSILNLDDYVDKNVCTRIGGTASDFMVGFGIASIKISVVINFWQPIVMLIVFGLVWNLFNLFIVAPRVFGSNYWFERGIFTYGWTCGTMAFGVILLRIVDPDFNSGALTDYGLAYILIAPIEIFIVALGPVFYCTMGLLTTALFVIAALGLMVVMRLYFWQGVVEVKANNI